MSHRLLEPPKVAKKAKPGQDEPVEYRDRIDLRANPVLVRRIARQAKRFGMSLSTYIRQAVILCLEKDEATDQPAD